MSSQSVSPTSCTCTIYGSTISIDESSTFTKEYQVSSDAECKKIFDQAHDPYGCQSIFTECVYYEKYETNCQK